MNTTTHHIPIIKTRRYKRARFDNSRWYAIQIMPQLHHIAHFHLTNQGFHSFFPTIQVRPTRTQFQIEPLFKGYGFVHFDPATNTNWRAINSTRGVISLVPKHQLIPQPIPKGFVEFLIDHNPLTEVLFDQSLDLFYPGLEVRVNNDQHLLHNRRATIVSLRGRFAEVIFTESYNPNRVVLINSHSLVPLPNEPPQPD